MSFSDSRPPYMQQHFFDDSIGCWPQFEHQHLQFDQHSPPFKKPRKFEESQSDSISYSMIPPNAPVNKGTTNIFFKTRLCAKFKMGMCRNGENCNFAHGIEDTRQPPPNWQELIGLRDEDGSSSGNWEDDQKIIHRMKLCKKFYNGEECPYGDRCNFLHEDPAKFRDDMGRFRESSAISIGISAPTMVNIIASNQSEDNGSVNAGSDTFRVNMKPVYWKTRLCNKWETTGHCPFGEKCHFAHGQAELQLLGGRVESEALNSGAFGTKHEVTINDSIGRVELEALNSGAFGTKPQVTINDSVPIATTMSAYNEDSKGKKCLLKWKGLKKIDRIYADWLDDLPLPSNPTSKMET